MGFLIWATRSSLSPGSTLTLMLGIVSQISTFPMLVQSGILYSTLYSTFLHFSALCCISTMVDHTFWDLGNTMVLEPPLENVHRHHPSKLDWCHRCTCLLSVHVSKATPKKAATLGLGWSPSTPPARTQSTRIWTRWTWEELAMGASCNFNSSSPCLTSKTVFRAPLFLVPSVVY